MNVNPLKNTKELDVLFPTQKIQNNVRVLSEVVDGARELETYKVERSATRNDTSSTTIT